MSVQPQQDALYKEGRLDLACQSYKQGNFQSVLGAATSFDIPNTTLRRPLRGIQPKRGSIAKNRLLTPTEEETLESWILSMDQRGMPLRLAAVRQMAGLLLAQRDLSRTVGKNWAVTFVDCHNSLKTKYNRKYDYQRAKSTQCNKPPS
jgi:hypothetical protein